MWGYDTDEDDNLVIYLTDSDDYAVGMFRQKVVVNDYTDENGLSHCDIYLTSMDGENDVYSYNYEEAGLTGIRPPQARWTVKLSELRPQ